MLDAAGRAPFILTGHVLGPSPRPYRLDRSILSCRHSRIRHHVSRRRGGECRSIGGFPFPCGQAGHLRARPPCVSLHSSRVSIVPPVRSPDRPCAILPLLPLL